MNLDINSTRAVMQAHIEACKLSGQKVEHYCKAHDIKPSNYYYWRKVLQNNIESQFTKVTPVVAMSSGCAKIIFTSGHQIVFDELPPAGYIKQLVS